MPKTKQQAKPPTKQQAKPQMRLQNLCGSDYRLSHVSLFSILLLSVAVSSFARAATSSDSGTSNSSTSHVAPVATHEDGGLPTALANTAAIDNAVTNAAVTKDAPAVSVDANAYKLSANASWVLNTPSIEAVADTLAVGDYQTVPLQTIADPSTGVVIDDIYQMSVPDTLSLLQAQHVLAQVSPKLASNNAAIAARQFQAEATQSIKQPWVFLRAGATHYDLDADVDLTDIKAGINNSVAQAATNPAPALPPTIDPTTIAAIPPLVNAYVPDNYNLNNQESRVSAGVAVVWPIYSAGRTEAIQSLAQARSDESVADAGMDYDALQTTLIQRYFSAQLAVIAAYLREDALNTTKETDHMAQRLLEEGFISQVERLEAKTALAEAQSNTIKANNDAQLAMTALQRLLRTPTPVQPTTPLFVSSQPLPPLAHFQQLALQHHPGLQKIDAKYAQAQSLHRFSDTGLKPNVVLFGYHQLDNNPSWIAGVSASWRLWGGLNKQALAASSNASIRQALLAKIDTSDNILLLVEKNWQSVENARVRYASLNSNVLLAEELLRYKQLGLREGVNTTLDVTTAQTRYLQARTEQASVANDYVQALAALMQSCGTPKAFNEYMHQADIRLPTLY